MKQNKLESVQSVLNILMNHLLVIAAIITIFDLFQIDGPMIMVCVCSLFIPFGYYFMTHRPQKILFPPLFIVFLQLMSMLERIMKKNDWQIYYFVIAFVYFLGYFLCYFLKQYINFLTLNKSSASNIPEEDMLQSGIKQTFVFGCISTIVLLLTINFDWVKKIADSLWIWFLQLLGYVFSGIETPPPPEEFPMEDINQATSGIGNAVDREMFPVFMQETVKTVVIGVVFVAFVGGCILLLLLVYEFIKKYFTPLKRKHKQKVIQNNEDIREYCGVEKNKSKKEFSFLFLNHREKIRKLYQRKVIKRKDELVGEKAQKQLEYMTAKECCDRLSEENLKVMYEKARYSAEKISAEDVRIARMMK